MNVKDILLIGTVLLVGVMSGFFFAFTNNVQPALTRVGAIR